MKRLLSGYQRKSAFQPLHLSGKQTPEPLQNPIKQMSFVACLEVHQIWAFWPKGEGQIPKLRLPQWVSSLQSIFYGIIWFVHLTLFFWFRCAELYHFLTLKQTAISINSYYRTVQNIKWQATISIHGLSSVFNYSI